MRYSIFSVNDHHPRLPRTVPQLYQQVMALDAALVERSMTLFAREVMPALATGTSTRERTSGSARLSSGARQ